MFRALAYDLYGNEDLQQNTKNLLQQFLSELRTDGADFQGIDENDIPILEELIDRNIQIFTILLDDDSKMFAKLTRRSSMNRLQTTSLLRYENHICWTADINKFLKKFRCYICDHFYDRSYNLVNHMKNCSETTQHKYPSGAYQLSDTIFDRLEEFNIIVPDELRLFPNLIVYDFESITVHDSTIKNTELTSWIGKHVPISVSLCSNFNPDTLFICNEDPNQLIRDFVQNLVALSASIMKEKLQTYISQLQEKYYSVRGLVPVMENEQRSMERNFFDNEAGIDHDDDDDQDPETQRYKWELKTLSNLIQDFESYYSTVPVFGFNSSRYDLNLIKEYLLSHLLLEKNVVPKVIRQGNKYIGLNFLGLQFLDILNFLGGTSSLASFLKAYGASEEKGFSPMSGLTLQRS